LRLVLAPSRALAALIVALHAAAGAAAFVVLPGAAGAALGALLLALGIAAARSRALLRGRRSPRALEIRGESLVVELAGGARIEAAHPGRCHVSRLAVILPLAGTVLVTADMLGAAEFRRLRLWALWRKLPAVAAKQLAA
jgi:hypothetical protein